MATTKGVFRAGRVLASDSKWTGEEPEWEGWQKWDVEKFFKTRGRMLNFYNYYLTSSDTKPALLAFMKREGFSKDDISLISAANPGAVPSTLGNLIRAMDRGMPSMHPNAQDHFDKLPFIEGAIAKDDKKYVIHELGNTIRTLRSMNEKSPSEVKKKSPESYLSPMERLRIKVDKDVISPLEEMLDTWCTSEVQVAPLRLTSYIRDNAIPASGCTFIESWIT